MTQWETTSQRMNTTNCNLASESWPARHFVLAISPERAIYLNEFMKLGNA